MDSDDNWLAAMCVDDVEDSPLVYVCPLTGSMGLSASKPDGWRDCRAQVPVPLSKSEWPAPSRRGTLIAETEAREGERGERREEGGAE